jgi:hypothetical protein
MLKRVPTELKSRAAGRRVLAWATSRSSWLAATEAVLLLPDGFESAELSWDLILRVTWPPDLAEVTYQESAGGAPRIIKVPIQGEFEVLAAVVREQVMASIVVQHHVAIDGDRGARLVARRVPGETEFRWSVVFDSGIDSSDPVVHDRVDAALATLRTSLGV